LKYVLALSCGLLVAANAAHAAGGVSQINVEAKRGPWADADHTIYTPIKGGTWNPGMNKANITYHGGPTITSAKVVMIFWGPSFATGGADHTYATTLQAFRNQLGTTGEYNTITQYSGIQLANLGSGSADWFDSSTPPTNVTDSQVQAEVGRYLQTHTFNSSTIYSVFIPRTSYSSSGSSTSCGGPGLAYCAYHSWTGSSSSARKYSIEPWPGCSGCKVSGWSDAQNAEHFFVHEVREAVTDPNGSAWFDNVGNEADDKCAWSPTPFIGTNGYGYQYEWSNANGGCIRTR
jgi:hypothetical protein